DGLAQARFLDEALGKGWILSFLFDAPPGVQDEDVGIFYRGRKFADEGAMGFGDEIDDLAEALVGWAPGRLDQIVLGGSIAEQSLVQAVLHEPLERHDRADDQAVRRVAFAVKDEV